MHRAPLTPVLALGAFLTASSGSATAMAQSPAPDALDFAPLDLGNLTAAGGAVWGLDRPVASADLRGGLTVARARSLGLGVQAVRFEVGGRPGAHTTSVYASLVDLDEWMIGEGTSDTSPCLAWLSPALSKRNCADDAGYFGFGSSLLAVDHDTQTDRTALRAGEIDGVLSPTRAYAPPWKERRLLLRLGASADYVWKPPGLQSQWVARMDLGADAQILLAPLQFSAYVRWRPNLGHFVDDFGIEAGVTSVVLWQGPGLVASGQRWQAGIDVGYAHWEVPSLSFGPDWLLSARDTLFVRLVFSPTLASLTPSGL